MRSVFLTIGDISKIYGISKQTILYYEKLGLFKPYKVEENGYRYYTLEECYQLEMILSLKKLDVSLKDIQDYIEHRGVHMLHLLLDDARYGYDRKIEKLYQKKMSIEYSRYTMERYLRMPLHRIFLQMNEEKRYVLTPYHGDLKPKAQLVELLQHQADLIHDTEYRELKTGMVIAGESYESGHILSYTDYCTEIGFSYEGVKEATIRPRGMYIEIYFQGPYSDEADELHEKVTHFMEREKLDIAGSIYVEPIRNYWTESDRYTYVSRLSIPVEEKLST